MAFASSFDNGLLGLVGVTVLGCPLRLVTPPALPPMPFAPPIRPIVGILYPPISARG